MATYTHEQASTKRFYFDIDASFPITVAMPSIIEDSFASLKGVVVNVVGRIGMRVTTAGASLDGVEFILFQYFSGCIPSQWALKGDNCYRPTKTTDRQTFPQKYNSSPDSFKPYILARSERFSGYWSGEKYHTMNFTPTDLGKNIENWTGRICLAVVYYDAGSAHTYWCWDKEVGRYTLQYAQESPLSGLESSTFKLGTTSTVTIAPYSTAYKHKVTWKLGNNSYTSDFIPAGTTTASYTLPTGWRPNFGEAENTKSGTVSIDTYDTDGSKIGETKSYSVTYTIDDYNYNSKITIKNNHIVRSNRSTRFKNSIFDNYLVSGYDTFYIPLETNFSSYNSKSKSISVLYNSITKSKNINVSSVTGSDASSLLHTANKGSILMQVKVTDQRGKTGTLNCGYDAGENNYKDICDYSYLTYYEPQIGDVSFYRGRDINGTRDDAGGTIGIVKFSNYKASYSSPSLTTIKNTINLTLKNSQGNQVGVASTTIASGSTKAITLYFAKSASDSTHYQLSLDEEYTISGTITDLSGYSQSISGKIFSSGYLLHFRYSNEDGTVSKQKSIGIGQAGRDLSDDQYSNYKNSGLLSIAFPIELPNTVNSKVNNFTAPIRIEDGGTGSGSQTGALANLGAFPSSGGTLTGNLTIDKNKTIYLIDSKDQTFSALYAGSNFYIGLGALKGLQKHGPTYIGLGRTLNDNGTYTINRDLYLRQSPTTEGGEDGETYTVYHDGNIFYSADSTSDGIPDSIPGGKAVKGMIWLKPIT